MDAGTVQDIISISLIRTANDLAKQSAEILYASIGTPVALNTDSYIPSDNATPVTYTAQGTTSNMS